MPVANDTLHCDLPTAISLGAASCVGTFVVELLPEGIGSSPAPTLAAAPTFALYNASNVALEAVQPVAVPLGAASARLVVDGTHFEDYGDGQLICELGGVVVHAERLAATRLACPLVASQLPSEAQPLAISLNNGTAGSYAGGAALTIAVFAPPTVHDVSPGFGAAIGGELVMVLGEGFDALGGFESGDAGGTTVVCRFGGLLSPETVLVNATHVGCVTPIGSESSEGSLVEVSLNGQHFVGGATFDYYGLHPPALVGVRFSPSGDRAFLHFDAQPTNRAGQNGVFDCAAVLSDESVAQVQGASAAPARCRWASDTLLLALLSTYSTLVPGGSLGIRNGVLWPRAASGCTTSEGDMCAYNETAAISVDLPCDDPTTAAIERCVVPVAIVQGPTSLSACPNSPVSLDASFSTGGGTRSLAYEWSIHPTLSDAATTIGDALGAAGSVSVVRLRSELNGGQSFLFLLRVRNFLGEASKVVTHPIIRRLDAAPTVFIDAPPSLTLSATGGLALQARAQLASCFADGAAEGLRFNWTAATQSGAPLALDLEAATRSAYMLRGSALEVGSTYVFTVTSCLGAGQMCGTASVLASVRDEPLVARISGGDRSIGQDSALVLDASASADPDDPSAVLAFEWTCTSAGVCPTITPEAVVTLPPRSLSVGNYTFTVNVTHPSTGDSDLASVSIDVLSGALPTVTIVAAAKPKQNPSSAIRLRGSASLVVGGASLGLTLAWTSSPPLNLTSSLISSTGASKPNLVLLGGVLTPGATYTFMLSAQRAGSGAEGGAGSAAITLTMNTPPFGGALRVSPESGREMVDVFTLTSYDWADDAEDLPLRYSFAATSNGTLGELGAISLSQRLDVRLAAGAPVVLVVTVFDQLDAAATATVGAVVEEATLDAEVVDTVVADAAEKLQAGDSQAATQSTAALASSLNAKQGSASRRLSEGGEASSEGLDDASSTALRTSLVTTLDQAARTAAVSAKGLKQSSEALAITAANPKQLESSAVATGASMIRAIVTAAVGMDEALSDGTEGPVINSISAMLRSDTAEATELSAEGAEALRDMGDAVASLPTAMLRERLPGEAASEVVSERIQMAVAMEDTTSLEGLPFRSAPTADGLTNSFVVPEGALGPSLPPVAVGESAPAVGVAMTVIHADTHAGENVGDKGPQTATTSIVVSDGDGPALRVSNLPEPIVIRLAAPWTAVAVEGTSESVGTRGACVAGGACYCDALHRGADCAEALQCSYWDEEERLWSTAGCTTQLPSTPFEPTIVGGLPIFEDATLVCHCTHLTEFAGLAVPATTEELIDELEAVTNAPARAAPIEEAETSMSAEVAAARLQAAERRRHARLDFVEQRQAALYIQAHARGHIANRKFLQGALKAEMASVKRSRLPGSFGALVDQVASSQRLSKLSSQRQKELREQFKAELWYRARMKHSLLSAAAPVHRTSEDGEWVHDPRELTDGQNMHIFWTVLSVGFVALAMLNDTEETTDTDAVLLVTRVIKGLYAAACILLVSNVCRRIFMCGNAAARRKKERLQQSEQQASQTATQSTMVEARNSAQKPRPTGARAVCASALSRALRKIRRSSRGWMVAWFFNEAILVASLWTFMAYGAYYGVEETDAMLEDWGIGLGLAWGLLEPFQIVLLVSLLVCVQGARCAKTIEKPLQWLFDACG